MIAWCIEGVGKESRVRVGSALAGKAALLKILVIDIGPLVLLVQVDQPAYLQGLEQIDQLAVVLGFALAEVLGDWGCVLRADLFYQFCGVAEGHRLHHAAGYLGTYSEFELEVLPLDAGGLLPDGLGGLLDDAGELVFQFVFGGEVLLGIDAQQVVAALLAARVLRGVGLALEQVARVGLVGGAAGQLVAEGLPDGVHDVVLVDDDRGGEVRPHGHFQRDGLLGDGVDFLLAQDHLQDFLERVFVAAVQSEFLGDAILDERDELLEFDPAELAVREHEAALETVDEPAAVLAEGDGVEIHVGNQGQHARRQVGFDGGVRHALVHETAEQLLRVVQGDVVLLVVRVHYRLDLAFERRERAQHAHESLGFERLVEAVQILLAQIGDLLGDENDDFVPGVLLEEDVHLEHEVAHLGALQKQQLDSFGVLGLLGAGGAFGGKHLVLALPELLFQQNQKMVKLLLLVFSYLHRENLPLHAVSVLTSAHAHQVIHRLLQVLLHQLVLQLFAGSQHFLVRRTFRLRAAVASVDLEFQLVLLHKRVYFYIGPPALILQFWGHLQNWSRKPIIAIV